MSVTNKGWKNKNGTSNRTCNCGSWKNHWINNSGEKWPDRCSVLGCNNSATLGAHIINNNVSGEYIVPDCDSCNQSSYEFDLRVGIKLVPANKQKTCEK